MPLPERVISFYPTSHGFGFTVFESDHTLIDWGHTNVRPAGHDACLERIWQTIMWYAPSVVVLEDTSAKSSRRGKRVTKLLDEVARLVDKTPGVRLKRFSPEAVREAFDPQGKITKQQMAELVATYFDELRFQVPPPRKIWMSEDDRMSIHSAAALAMVWMYGVVCEGEIR